MLTLLKTLIVKHQFKVCLLVKCHKFYLHIKTVNWPTTVLWFLPYKNRFSPIFLNFETLLENSTMKVFPIILMEQKTKCKGTSN